MTALTPQLRYTGSKRSGDHGVARIGNSVRAAPDFDRARLPHRLDEVEPAAGEPCLAARNLPTTGVYRNAPAIGDVGVRHEPPATAGGQKPSASS